MLPGIILPMLLPPLYPHIYTDSHGRTCQVLNSPVRRVFVLPTKIKFASEATPPALRAGFDESAESSGGLYRSCQDK